MHGQNTRSRFEYGLPRIRQHVENLRARDVTPDAVESLLKELEAVGLAPSSVNQHRTILNSIFNFAVKREKYDRNPVSAVPHRKEPPGRDRFLTPEEFHRLAAECRADPQLDAFLWLAVTTGARKGDILSRLWRDVQIEGVAPHLYVPRTKNCPRETLSAGGGGHSGVEAVTQLSEGRVSFSSGPRQCQLRG